VAQPQYGRTRGLGWSPRAPLAVSKGRDGASWMKMNHPRIYKRISEGVNNA
jgi:hypothetical protein